jgi:hypothetical protein
LYIGRETDSLVRYPNVLRHLSKFRGVLQQRREVENGTIQFFQLQWPREADIFEGSKIVVPYRCEEAAFALNAEQWFCRSDCYVITQHKEDYSLLFLLAILNSSISYTWLYYKGKRKGNMLELFQVPLAEIPVAKPTVKVKVQLEKLVEKRLGLEAGPEAEAVEREIDQVVYGLYGLTEEEIKIVEGSVKRKGSSDHPSAEGEDNLEQGELKEKKTRGRPRKGPSTVLVINETQPSDARTNNRAQVTATVAAAAQSILDYLATHPGKHGKSAIIPGARILEKDWNRAINQLLEEGRVKSEGQKRGAKYWV